MEKEMTPKIDLIVKCIPLFTGYLIFLGVVNEILFYRLFSVNILEYISLSEAILFSLNFLLPSSIYFVGGFIAGWWLEYYSRGKSF